MTARRLRAGDLTAADRETIAGLLTRLAWDQLEIIDGVPETLAELRGRHDLLLLTKGNHEEQAHKITRSGLAHLFRRTVITPEKTPDTYRDLVAEESLDPARTWMIGNSPRSDILPAVEAGLRGVFVPHEHLAPGASRSCPRRTTASCRCRTSAPCSNTSRARASPCRGIP